MTTQTQQSINDIICDHLRINPDDLTPSSDLISELGADSLDFYELAMNIESELYIVIPDENVQQWKTVQDIYNDAETFLKREAQNGDQNQ